MPIQPGPPVKVETLRPTVREEPQVVTEAQAKSRARVLPYHLVDGLMVVQGDLVAGVPLKADLPPTGLVEMLPVKLWPQGKVPYHIQPDVVRPERVAQAVAFFDGTAVHLVPYSNEDDAIVFIDANGECKSYVGKVGGKQPVFIGADCGPREIAHEIMHALGFIHEQNRTDRDEALQVHFENIDERYKDNFEKLSPEFMKVSGLGDFDFKSLMIYPAWMFAKNGRSTMEPKSQEKLIEPGSVLSALDLERLKKAYGASP